MCLICLDYQKGKMTAYEGLRNVREMNEKDPHTQEVLDFLLQELYNEEIERNVGGMHQEFDDYYHEAEPAIPEPQTNYSGIEEDEEWFDFWNTSEEDHYFPVYS